MDAFKAFCLGFACSKEGFNGECAYEALAPDKAFDGPMNAAYESMVEMEASPVLMSKLRELWEASS